MFFTIYILWTNCKFSNLLIPNNVRMRTDLADRHDVSRVDPDFGAVPLPLTRWLRGGHDRTLNGHFPLYD